MTLANDKPKWHCAVKNTTTDKTKWYYHLFYDFDGIELSSSSIQWIVNFMQERRMSFILRHTVHGYHLIGLTPVSSYNWGTSFSILQETFPTYHDGNAIRITKKIEDEFIIVAENYDYPLVLNLLKLFKKNYATVYKVYNHNMIVEQWYVLLYYTTNKKNILNKEVIANYDKKKRY